MKLKNFITLTIGLVLGLAAVGCKTKSGFITPLAQTGTGPVAHTPGTDQAAPLLADTNGVNSEGLNSTAMADPNLRKDWPRDREIFKADTVHFDYDSTVIKADEKSKISAVADYIKEHNSDALEIEGYCDERGTEEYNRALGERRALALREELIRLGLDPSRVDTVSFGEDRPADAGHNEVAYKKNRRGEFVLEKHQTLAGLQ